MTSSNKCQATTKAGTPCKRNAQDGSIYCYSHRSLAATAAEQTPPPQAPVEEQPMAAPAIFPASQARFQEIMQQLNVLADDLRQRFPDYAPPPFSAEKFLDSTRQALDKYSPEVVKEIRESLTDAKPEDFRDPETWKNVWLIVSHALERDSKTLLDKVVNQASTLPGVQQGKDAIEKMPTMRESREKIEQIPAVKKGKEMIENLPGYEQGKAIISSLPGASLVTNVAGKLDKTAPKDFFEKKTWTDIWYVLNHSLEGEISGLKKRVQGNEPEEEIIEVSGVD